MRRHAVLLALSLVLAAGPGAADTAESVIGEARAACEGFENGVFATAPGTVTEVDLTGDGVPEQVVDEGTYSCSSAASMYCGTGGCTIVAVVGGAAHRFLVKGWRVVDWDGVPVLLTQIHGANCGGMGLVRCYEALVWDGEGRFLTVRPPAQ